MASAYSEEQIDQYLDYIAIPPDFHRKADPVRNVEYLNALHTHQLSTIPYENLSLHYSKDHRVILDPQALYNKVLKNGRGGYCMENSIFFNHILRGLGFQVYTAGARVRNRYNGIPQGDFMGWVHIVNIVTLSDGAKYMVDVGFGGDGATAPLPLLERHVTHNIGSQDIQLVHGTIDQQVDKSRKLWIYQYRNGVDKPWNSFYCFPEFEFLHADFEVMNCFTSTSPDCFQTSTVLVIKFLRKSNEIYGKIMLVNAEVKENTGGKTSVVKVCKSDDERVEALREYFGITITEEQREGIRGWRTELR